MKSPCVKICQLNPFSSYCMGCYRNIDEITEWSRMSDQEREMVYNRIVERVSDEVQIEAAELGGFTSREYEEYVEKRVDEVLGCLFK